MSLASKWSFIEQLSEANSSQQQTGPPPSQAILSVNLNGVTILVDVLKSVDYLKGVLNIF